MQDRGKGKVQRPQAKNGKDVRGVDDERIGGDGEHRRHRIHRKDQIGNLDQDQRQKQRRGKGHQLAGLGVGLFDEKGVALQILGHSHPLFEELQHRIGGDIMLFFTGSKQHFHPGQDQKHRKDIQDPVILRDQRGADANHDAPQHDHPQNAPEQHAVLIGAGDGKEREDQRDDKDIVQRQGLFHHKGGQILRGGGEIHLPVDETGKAQAQGNVQRRQPQTLRHADFVIAGVQQAQIQHQKAQNHADKGQPHPQRCAEKQGKNYVQIRLLVLRDTLGGQGKPPDPTRAHSDAVRHHGCS